MDNIKKEILKLEYALGLTRGVTVKDYGNCAPEKVLILGNDIKEVRIDATDEEVDKYLKLRNARNINMIKNCALFFTILTSLSILSVLIYLLDLLSKF